MKISRILYRVRQFGEALLVKPSAQDIALAREYLTPAQMHLFCQMPLRDQAHSLAVLRRLMQGDLSREDGRAEDLYVAALLHDVGKSRYPLRLWERVIIVLARRLFPRQARAWSEGAPKGWRRPFVVAEKHPEWGAQMAAEAGASPLTVYLIRYHQKEADFMSTDRLWLRQLQAADHES
jgi:hypothetical protein